MQIIFEACEPRREVLEGELREQQFAASLTKVVRGTADDIYLKPSVFFANTYPTGGLKALLKEALGRLSGVRPDYAAVIRLETNFGGGKTHNLIALEHAATGDVDPDQIAEFVSPEYLPSKPIELTAAIVGPDMDAADGFDHGDVRTFTLWGEMAYQLGGAAAYELVRKSDEQRIAPGTQVWEKLIGDRPALLMIDEIAYYLRGAEFQVGKTSLAEQTVAFLMSLIKFASESKQTVLVYTLADSSDAFGKETDELRQELAEARSVSARQEHVLTPTAEDEISAIASPRTGSPAHAQEIDESWLAEGRPPYARRVATTVFLHSLVQTGHSGVDPADVRLAVLQPDDDPALIDRAMQRLIDRCWFFDYDGLRYRFKTEPSPRKIIDDEMGIVGKIKAKSELDERIQKVWKKGVLHPVYFPTEAAGVDDDTGPPKLVVLHYDAARVKATDAAVPPDLVLKLFEHKGSMEEYRTYKNNVMFLVADADQVDRMVDVAQFYLATRRVVADAERMREFSAAVADKLKGMAEAAELDLRVAVTKAYRHLYYPSADAPRKAGNLAHHPLPAEDQGKVPQDQTEVVLGALKSLEKTLTADDKPLNAPYVKAKAWPANTASLSTEDLRKAFCQRLRLKMLLDVNQLKKTIKEGAQKGVWIYYPAAEGMGYGPPSPTPMVEISDDATLYTPDEAERVGVKIKGVEPEVQVCPVCDKPAGECVCDQGGDNGGDEQPPRITAQGTPAQAFQTIADQCHDSGAKSLSRLFVRIEGMGKEAARDVRSLGLAIPQMGKAQLQLDQQMVLEFGEGEKFSVQFAGSWDRYERIKSITDALSQEAANASVRVALRADFEAGLSVDGDQFQTIRDVLDSLGMGKIFVDGEPKSEEAGP